MTDKQLKAQWDSIAKQNQELEVHNNDTLKKAKAIGDALNTLRKQYKHGEWMPELKKHFKKTRRAHQYMEIANTKNWKQIEIEFKKNPIMGIVDAYYLVLQSKRQAKGWKGHLRGADKELFDKSYTIWTNLPEDDDKWEENAKMQRQLCSEYSRKKKQKDRPLRFGKHFFDSGAYSLPAKAEAYAKKKSVDRYSYYDTEEFFGYMDNYAGFIQEYGKAIDWYANVDAIGSPKLTYRNQLYLESRHNLKPVPVIHYPPDGGIYEGMGPTDLGWLEFYMERDLSYAINKEDRIIAISGLRHFNEERRPWFDEFFKIVCDQANKEPLVRIHAFGTTSPNILRRYPLWSCDSSTWMQAADKHGSIHVPKKQHGKFTFELDADTIPVGLKVDKKERVRGQKKKNVLEWLEMIEVPYGTVDGTKPGVINNKEYRGKANVLFHELLRFSLPAFPWALPNAGKLVKVKSMKECIEAKDRTLGFFERHRKEQEKKAG